ncbi:MAG: hypothetical protein AAGE52_08700 [Myxococcota bacterium]
MNTATSALSASRRRVRRLQHYARALLLADLLGGAALLIYYGLERFP